MITSNPNMTPVPQHKLAKAAHFVPGLSVSAAIALVSFYLGKLTPVFNDVIIAIITVTYLQLI